MRAGSAGQSEWLGGVIAINLVSAMSTIAASVSRSANTPIMRNEIFRDFERLDRRARRQSPAANIDLPMGLGALPCDAMLGSEFSMSGLEWRERRMTLVVDDAQLMRLAVQPPRDAAMVLRRTAAFRPVVLLLCVFPPIWFAAWSTLDSASAPWALRALAVQHTHHLEEWLEPGSQWAESDLRAAPPLVSWLTAVVLNWFPAGSALAPALVSSLSLMGAIALLWQWCREAIGERAALIVTILFALHPQIAPLAATGAPTALTLFLLIASAWGFWGHLEQDQGAVSFRLLAGGIACGLALLAGGMMAIALFVVLLLACLAARITSNEAEAPVGERSALRGILLMGATGAAIAAWWPAMMVQALGLSFIPDWLGFHPSSQWEAGAYGVHDWTDWLTDPGLLLGWWCLGAWSAVRICLHGTETRFRRWCQWLLIWNVVGLAGRATWYALNGTPEALRNWEAFFCLPATLLAAQGLDRALRRETSRLGLAAAIAVTLAAVGWQFTHQLSVALVMGGSMLLLLLASAPLALGLRRARATWSEAEIRAWVLVAAVATALGHAACSIVPLTKHEFDHTQWETIRQRMAASDGITQTSVIANDRRDLVPWIYLVRSLWPEAKFSQSTGWDPQITATLVAEAGNPESRIVLFDWSRSGLRFRADVGTGWQVDSVVEPMAFRGRRLAVYLIHPTESPLPL